jgi:hypothetical protein
MTPVGARGETIIRSGDAGEEHRILFTNRALAEAESATGKSVIAIAQGFANGATGIGDVAQMLAVGLEAARRDAKLGGRAYTLGDAYRIMDEVGFTIAARAVMEAVAAVLKFGNDAEAPEGESPKETKKSKSS